MSMSYSGFKIPMTADRADAIIPMLHSLRYVLAVRHVEGEVHVAFDRLVREEVWDNHFVPILSALLSTHNTVYEEEWDNHFVPIERDFHHVNASLPVDLELQKYVNELKSQADADMQNVDEWAQRQQHLANASRLLVQAFDPERHDRLYGPRREV